MQTVNDFFSRAQGKKPSDSVPLKVIESKECLLSPWQMYFRRSGLKHHQSQVTRLELSVALSFPIVTILLLPASWCSSDGLPFGGVLNVDGQSWMNRGTTFQTLKEKTPEYF